MSHWRRRNILIDYDKRISTKEAFQNNMYILKLVWNIHPQRIIADFVKHAINQLSRVFYSIIFIRYLLEGMEQGIDFSNRALSKGNEYRLSLL